MTRWAFTNLGRSCDIEVGHADDAAALQQLLPPDRAAPPTLAWYRFDRADGCLLRDGECIAEGDLSQVVEQLVRDIDDVTVTAAAQEQTVLHCGAIRWQDRLVLLLGRSQAGKSTLVSWLAEQGGDYLGDDAIALRGSDVVASAIPAKIRPGATAILGPLHRPVATLTAQPSELQLVRWPNNPHPPEPPSRFVILDRQPGASAAAMTVRKSEVVRELSFSTFGFHQSEQQHFPQLLRLAESVPAVRLTYDGLREAERCLTESDG